MANQIIDLSEKSVTMHSAAAKGQMTVCKHEGFWQCMDTQRGHALLNDLWRTGKASWKASVKSHIA